MTDPISRPIIGDELKTINFNGCIKITLDFTNTAQSKNLKDPKVFHEHIDSLDKGFGKTVIGKALRTLQDPNFSAVVPDKNNKLELMIGQCGECGVQGGPISHYVCTACPGSACVCSCYMC